MKSIFLLNLGLLTAIFIAIDFQVSLTFLIVSIASIENSISVSGIRFKNNKQVMKDFRFIYAKYASRIYYSLSIFVSYFIYLSIKIYLNNQNILTEKIDYLFFVLILLFFIIFRIASQEVSSYLIDKNPFETKEIASVKNKTTTIKRYKETIIAETNSWINLSEDLETKSLLRNLINSLKYSSSEFDQALLEECLKLTNALETSLPKDQINKIVNKLLAILNN